MLKHHFLSFSEQKCVYVLCSPCGVNMTLLGIHMLCSWGTVSKFSFWSSSLQWALFPCGLSSFLAVFTSDSTWEFANCDWCWHIKNLVIHWVAVHSVSRNTEISGLVQFRFWFSLCHELKPDHWCVKIVPIRNKIKLHDIEASCLWRTQYLPG